MKNLKEIDVKNKKVIVRVDYNVPLGKDGIVDDARIKASLPTIKYLLQSGAKEIYLISHLGRPVVRPKEKIEAIIAGNKNLVLKPIAENLTNWLKIKTKPQIKSIGISLPAYKLNKNIYLLENIRFDSREEKNDPEFAKELASLGEIFVMDAFGAAHRAHASIVGVAKLLPSCAGFLVEKEVENLSKLLAKPDRPFVVILGGAKIDDKIMALKNIYKKADQILLGGVMANTFLKARNYDIKKSLFESQRLEIANDLFDLAPKKYNIPVDFIWWQDKIVDIGPNTILNFEKIVSKAKTIFYNGTMGLTSLGNRSFDKGTKAIINAIANSGATSIICGGDTIAEVDALKLNSKISFVSTGGGASLEFLSGKPLPGIEILG